MKPVSAGLSWAVCVGSLARLSRCGCEHQIRHDGLADVVLACNWQLLEAITEGEKRLQRLGDERGAGTRQTARDGRLGGRFILCVLMTRSHQRATGLWPVSWIRGLRSNFIHEKHRSRAEIRQSGVGNCFINKNGTLQSIPRQLELNFQTLTQSRELRALKNGS
jgi:hypothetical protein